VRQLTNDSIRPTRVALSAKQKHICPICNSRLTIGTPALDHCHDTGHVRATLCQSCNVGEGKVKAALKFRTPKSNMAYTHPANWLRKLADYLDHHRENPSGLIHPSFDVKTGKQKPVKRRAK